MLKAPRRVWFPPHESSNLLGVTSPPTQSPILKGTDPHRKSPLIEHAAGRHPIFPLPNPNTRSCSAAVTMLRVLLNCWIVKSLRVYRVITETPEETNVPSVSSRRRLYANAKAATAK